jgi:hypothetical protein
VSYIPPQPNWTRQNPDIVSDSSERPYYNDEYVKFPEYIDNPAYPFTFNFAITSDTNKFAGSDNRERFENLLEIRPANWKYRTKEVEYIVNSNGFRCKEWKDIDWKNAIVIFGCSCTFGTGLAEDETISHYLSQLTGREVVNLGIISVSNEVIANNIASMIKYFDMPYGVVVNWSSPNRLRFYNSVNYCDLGPWSTTPGADYGTPELRLVNREQFWQNTYANPTHSLVKNHYLKLSADAMLKNRTKYTSVTCFLDTAYFMNTDEFFKMDGEARDGWHPGSKVTSQIAEFVEYRFR